MKNLLFNFEEMASSKDKIAKIIGRQFGMAGQNIVQTDISESTKRSSGVSFREMTLTFADSQTITLRVKQTGDIFQVLLNNKVIPIKNQDDHAKAVTEIAQNIDKGRAQFQKKLAATKVAVPKGIKTAAPKIEQVLTEKRDSLKEAIRAVNDEIGKLQVA